MDTDIDTVFGQKIEAIQNVVVIPKSHQNLHICHGRKMVKCIFGCHLAYHRIHRCIRFFNQMQTLCFQCYEQGIGENT